jgi:hypothetical protein
MQVTKVKESKQKGPGGLFRRKVQLMDSADQSTVRPSSAAANGSNVWKVRESAVFTWYWALR